MGRVHALTTTVADPPRRTSLFGLARAADITFAGLALIAALPLMLVLALAVRRTSHGPVLHRDPGFDPHGRPVDLLSFRTSLDGASTTHHERLREVVGADAHHALTPVGRVMRATRTDRLPRLLNVIAGHTGILARR